MTITSSTSPARMMSPTNSSTISQITESVRLIVSNARIESALDVPITTISTKVCACRLVLLRNIPAVLLGMMMKIDMWKISVSGRTLSARSTTTLCRMAAAINAHSPSLLLSSEWAGSMNPTLSAL